jgi:hypothetical protein
MNFSARRSVLFFGWLTIALCAAAQQDTDNRQATSQAQTTLKVMSNLVLVRVVVHDAQGKHVEGLKKEDLRLFDQGKEQEIRVFEREAPATAAVRLSNSVETPPAASAPTEAPTALPSLRQRLFPRNDDGRCQRKAYLACGRKAVLAATKPFLFVMEGQRKCIQSRSCCRLWWEAEQYCAPY